MTIESSTRFSPVRSLDGFITPEQFGAKGDDPSFDDWPGIQAAHDEAADNGGVVWLHPERHYYLSQTLNYDPSRVMTYGNVATLDWSLKTFTDPSTLTEIVTNGDFAGAMTGWTVSGNSSHTPTFNTGNVVANSGNGSYSEIGQQLPLTAGTAYRVTVTMNDITTTTNGVSTFRSVGISFRPNGVGDGGSGGSLRWLANSDYQYTQNPRLWVFEITSPYDNPYLTIQANADYDMDNISVVPAPANSCIHLETINVGQGLRGHVERGIDRINMIGNESQTDLVDAILFDTTEIAYASRVNLTNMNINVGMGRGLVFQNRAYLINLWGSRVVSTLADIYTLPGSSDAGENIAVFGGNTGGGKIGIHNEGGFGLRFISHSCDFTRQWYVGGGQAEFISPWFETKQITAAEAAADPDFANTQYRFDVTGGELTIIGGYIQVGGNPQTNTEPEHMFRIAKNARVVLRDVKAFNLRGSSGEWATGEGRLIADGVRGTFSLTGGDAALPPVVHASDIHNEFGPQGSFDDDNQIGIHCWVQNTNNGDAERKSRHLVEFINDDVSTCDLTIGSNVITTASTAGLTVGRTLSHPGFPSGTTIKSIDSGTQLTATQNYNGLTAAGETVRFIGETAYGSSSMSISTAEARSGSQSLRFAKTGVGVGVDTIGRFAFPLRTERSVGTRLYFKVPAGTGDGATVGNVFFQGFYAKIEGLDNLTAIPKIYDPLVFLYDNPFQIDCAAGQDWTAISFETDQVQSTSQHHGVAPQWATHCMWTVELISMPDGFEIFFDDLHGNTF